MREMGLGSRVRNFLPAATMKLSRSPSRVRTRSCLLDRATPELLLALEHVAHRWLRLDPRLHDRVRFDCGDYRAARLEELKLSARVAAQRVRETGETFRFNPMSPRERRRLDSPGTRGRCWNSNHERRFRRPPAACDFIPPARSKNFQKQTNLRAVPHCCSLAVRAHGPPFPRCIHCVEPSRSASSRGFSHGCGRRKMIIGVNLRFHHVRSSAVLLACFPGSYSSSFVPWGGQYANLRYRGSSFSKAARASTDFVLRNIFPPERLERGDRIAVTKARPGAVLPFDEIDHVKLPDENRRSQSVRTILVICPYDS